MHTHALVSLQCECGTDIQLIACGSNVKRWHRLYKTIEIKELKLRTKDKERNIQEILLILGYQLKGAATF